MSAAAQDTIEDCIFCQIIQRRIPSTVVYENDRALAFLDIAPAAEGHTLIVPKSHADDLLAVTPEDLGEVARATRSVALLLDERLRPDGLTVFQTNREAGWQDVFHLHFHVVPRWDQDRLRRPWQSEPATAGQIAAVADRLA